MSEEFNVVSSGYENKRINNKNKKKSQRTDLLDEGENYNYNNYEYDYQEELRKMVSSEKAESTSNYIEETDSKAISGRILMILIIWALGYRLFIYWGFGLMYY